MSTPGPRGRVDAGAAIRVRGLVLMQYEFVGLVAQARADDLRASGTAELVERGTVRQVRAVEVGHTR
jgi:hypothetical protein